jgi:hypothetical protein
MVIDGNVHKDFRVCFSISTGHAMPNRAAQTGVFHLDIRISNRLFIAVCAAVAAETGLKSRNVEKIINAV